MQKLQRNQILRDESQFSADTKQIEVKGKERLIWSLVLQNCSEKYLLIFSRNGSPLAQHSNLLPLPSTPLSPFRRISSSPSCLLIRRPLFLLDPNGRPEQIRGISPRLRPAQVPDARSPLDAGGSPGAPAAPLRSAARCRVLREPRRHRPRLSLRQTRPRLLSGNSLLFSLPSVYFPTQHDKKNPTRPLLLHRLEARSVVLRVRGIRTTVLLELPC